MCIYHLQFYSLHLHWFSNEYMYHDEKYKLKVINEYFPVDTMHFIEESEKKKPYMSHTELIVKTLHKFVRCIGATLLHVLLSCHDFLINVVSIT